MDQPLFGHADGASRALLFIRVGMVLASEVMLTVVAEIGRWLSGAGSGGDDWGAVARLRGDDTPYALQQGFPSNHHQLSADYSWH